MKTHTAPTRKRCSSCAETKPRDQFNNNRSSPDGLQAYCRACGNERSRAWAKAHPEKMLEASKRHRKNKPELHMMKAARRRAAKFGIPFNLTEADILIPERCPVLDIPLRPGNGTLSEFSPSLDRIKPELGYVRGNTRVISMRCNRLKSDASAEELARILTYICSETQ